MFRSTGSYEPDLSDYVMKLSSIKFRSTGSYEPDHIAVSNKGILLRFRSTGSYEPDLHPVYNICPGKGFDPQALTSLTKDFLIL